MCQLRPPFTSEEAFGSDVSRLLIGVNVLYLDSWIQVDLNKKPAQVNTRVQERVSWQGPACYGHLDHTVIVFENELRRTIVGCLCIRRNRI